MSLHIDTTGHGPPLVLLHGWAMHAGVFAPLTRQLAPHFRVHLVDLPGHGHSRHETRLDLTHIITHLHQRIPADALWVGWSLGGMVALEAARVFPEHLRAIALIASSPCFVSGPDWPHGVPASVFEQFATGLERDFNTTVERFLALEAMGSAHASAELRSLRSQVFEHGAPALQALRQGLHLLQTCDLRHAVAELRPPSLWIAGRRDRLVPPQAMRWAADTAPRAQHLALDSGHMPFFAEPDTVTAALLALHAHSAAPA